MMFQDGQCMYDELGGCIKVDGCLWALGIAGCMSVDVHINIVYILPTIGGWYVGKSLH